MCFPVSLNIVFVIVPICVRERSAVSTLVLAKHVWRQTNHKIPSTLLINCKLREQWEIDICECGNSTSLNNVSYGQVLEEFCCYNNNC